MKVKTAANMNPTNESLLKKQLIQQNKKKIVRISYADFDKLLNHKILHISCRWSYP